MFKMLLASTALTALVSTSAFAASETVTTDAPAAATTMTDQSAAMHTDGTLASDLIGSTVYGSSSDDAETIGDINDIVISPEGDISSIIVGVGGFLGIGEKDVAVQYDTIDWVDRDGKRWLVANMTREQLESAPAFDRTAIYAEARSEAEGVEATKKMAADTENMTAPEETAQQKVMQIDRSMMTPVPTEKLSAENLIGQTVYGANDENIGEVGDVLLSSDNMVEGFVLDVGGFLGIGEKEVAISPQKIDILADADGNLTIFTPFTKEQLEAQKEYSEESWDAERDSVILVVPAG